MLTDIFTDKENNEGVTPPNPNALDGAIDLFADKLMSITKEDGSPKYDNVEKALDALKASQEHIARLERENAEREQKLNELTETARKAEELEELVRRMSNGDENAGKPNGNNPPAGGLSEEAAAELVKRILNETKQVDTAVNNVKSVQETLVAKFGSEEQAAQVIKTKAAELGTTAKQLKELSANNPAMVLALFGETKTSPSATTSSINSAGIKPQPEVLQRPEKSIISGPAATDKNRAELMAKIKKNVYAKYGVTE